MLQRMCKNCGACFSQVNKLNTLCPRCAYNKYMKPKKPLKRMGKVANEWAKARNEWIKQNPPNHEGYYTCGICYKFVHIDEVVIDHIKARARRPDLRYTQSNLQPAHYDCNQEKGSKDLTTNDKIIG